MTANGKDAVFLKNVNNVKAKIIVEGANIPIAEKYEEMLMKKRVLIIPDIVANAGGVISSYVEYKGYRSKKMFEIVKAKIIKNTKLVLQEAKNRNVYLRKVAQDIAIKRLKMAIKKIKSCLLNKNCGYLFLLFIGYLFCKINIPLPGKRI